MIFKKGNIDIEVIYLMLILFIFVIAMFSGNYILGDLNEDIQADPEMGNQTKAMMSQATSDYPAIMDNGFMIIFVLCWIVVLIAADFIDTHPVFLIVTIILMILLIIVAAILGNYYEEFNSEGDFANMGDSFPMAHYVMSHLVLFFFLMSVSVALVLYGKRRLG